jgi:hypothetical protein
MVMSTFSLIHMSSHAHSGPYSWNFIPSETKSKLVTLGPKRRPANN